MGFGLSGFEWVWWSAAWRFGVVGLPWRFRVCLAECRVQGFEIAAQVSKLQGQAVGRRQFTRWNGSSTETEFNANVDP